MHNVGSKQAYTVASSSCIAQRTELVKLQAIQVKRSDLHSDLAEAQSALKKSKQQVQSLQAGLTKLHASQVDSAEAQPAMEEAELQAMMALQQLSQAQETAA